jgi:photosynthetic reaction center cytochrome c subunit
MVRDLNSAYLEPLASVFPDERKGPLGDSPKLNCATCHQGVHKPLYGAAMAKDYPELGAARAADAKQSDAGGGAQPQRTNVARQ